MILKAAAPATNLKAINIPTFTDPAIFGSQQISIFFGTELAKGSSKQRTCGGPKCEDSNKGSTGEGTYDGTRKNR
ncbi:hypothetical protein CLCR_05314 [Cladophialophora carrionii]|uniref:Uncharacterized protein n=1 Tax=Cladophialophora carrionii TaxID=86049 RepID=A0A1C1CL56_9EURO|nr:hypothetical protein CLCR_05314 [Cladophialophora carrionii]